MIDLCCELISGTCYKFETPDWNAAAQLQKFATLVISCGLPTSLLDWSIWVWNKDVNRFDDEKTDEVKALLTASWHKFLEEARLAPRVGPDGKVEKP